MTSSPKIKDRALWNWGYVIYDYKGYIDNMVRAKLNMLVIWNDLLPENAAEIVAYAHENAVKVVFGYAWGWDNARTEAVPDLVKLSDDIVTIYENHYLPLNCDGIYFQSFTETSDEYIGETLIADAVTQLVNSTAEKLLSKYPSLVLQFGLHATSVKEKLEYIKRTDRRIYIVWEDCGAFPFAYIPKATDGFPETVNFCERIISLREKDDNFGVVLKGLTCLDWSSFIHQKGSFILGEAPEEFLVKKAREKEKFWKYVQSYWFINAAYAHEAIKLFTKNKNTICEALVEDGMFEKHLWFPVALYAAMLWEPQTDTGSLISQTALIPNVYFANY